MDKPAAANSIDLQEQKQREAADVEVALSTEESHVDHSVRVRCMASLEGQVDVSVLASLTDGI